MFKAQLHTNSSISSRFESLKACKLVLARAHGQQTAKRSLSTGCSQPNWCITPSERRRHWEQPTRPNAPKRAADSLQTCQHARYGIHTTILSQESVVGCGSPYGPCLSGLGLNRLLSQHSRLYWLLNAAKVMRQACVPLICTLAGDIKQPSHQTKPLAHGHSVREHDQHPCCQLFH